ncbi:MULTISPECIES: bile acid:sodium symporter family protein [Psychrobacter]|uniref:BASS family bile acid:Na+ symporter n=1 Tax=Psychrobacter fozii TaxID=198480 RepID=A0A2V4UZA9_9GAMM|nr:MULTISPECIES: bile acid:sodium symporter family protein [Psychrobacter]MBF0659628.1 bile acid:sodium symporter family protein [Psychrobacter sp. NG25]MBH0065900.1 bile acid:sodium symporter family protein [Psychrobacter sp. SZ93C1]MBH0086911.1 bile acid:sodium symporter family protein [Psychrobacter sp. SCQQ22]MBH0097110.1 bile acid:sodium symporter family protein [Psychrobacter sp. NZS113]PYE38000.1 BASS family bile acid:Na+ symporter [Psychrobacter fozii]
MEGVELVTFVNSKVIPIGIFLIMMGMGLSLVTNDFKRVVKYPKAVAIGLTNQLIFLPLVGFALATSMSLEPEYAVGVMLLVLCPGGTTSNLFTYLAKGDVALSVTMTAIASVITVFTIPIVLSFSLVYFMGAGSEFQLPVVKTMVSLIALTILPVSVGMLIKRYAPTVADKTQVMVSRFGVIFLSFLVLFLSYVQKDIIVEALIATGPVSLILNVSTMALGYYTSKWFGLNPAQRRSITMEVGLQNSTLSMFMALTLLANYKMSLTPAIYTLIMFLTAGIMVRVFSAQHNKAKQTEIDSSVMAARRL